MAQARRAQVVDGQLTRVDATGRALAAIPVGSPAWFAWLDDARLASFSVQTPAGSITVRRERQRNGLYWYAYRKRDRRLRKAYVGKGDQLTAARLDRAVATLLAESPSPRATPEAHLHVLGTPRVLRDDQPRALTVAKAHALLGYLALHDAPQRRDHLLSLLWPESAAAAAHKNLRNTLWAIRTALGSDLLHTGDRLALTDAVWVDVRSFIDLAERVSLMVAANSPPSTWTTVITNAQRALALYRGPLLDGLELADAPDFELWLTGARERIDQLHRRLLQSLVTAHRALGHWPDVLAVARRALEHDPLQEPLYRTIMEAHAHLGERAEALHAYETLRATLDRELGVEPLPETEALRAAILRGALAPAPPEPLAPPPARSPRSAPAPRTPFIGRAAERAALDAALQEAMHGQARVVLLSGEVGIGKTRLWREWSAALAPDHSTVLDLRCLAATQHLPFAPLAELFARDGCQERLRALGAGAQPAWAADVARSMPELGLPLPPLALATIGSPEEERRRVFGALAQAFRALAPHPLVLIIDDLQWADRATLDWLAYFVDRMRDQLLLLLATYRPEEASTPLIQVIADWSRAGAVQRIVLPRLNEADSRALLVAMGGDPARAAEAYRQSGGNPYFLTELARAAPGVVPPALADLVRARLEQLPDGAQQVLQAAAVLHPTIDFPTVRRVSGRDDDETLDALDALLRAALLAEQGRAYTFVHPLVVTVVTDDLSAARRAVLHRRAAAAQEEAHAGALAAVAGQLARHYAAAGEPARAARYAELAGGHALGLAAAEEAAEFYRQALALEPTAARQIGLGEALAWQGDLEAARGAYLTARRWYEQQGDRRGMASADLQLAGLALVIGQADTTVQLAEQVLKKLDETGDVAVRVRAEFTLGAGLQASGRSLAEAERHLQRAIDLAIDARLPALLGPSRFELGNVRAQRGDLAGARTAFRQVIAAARAGGEHLLEVLGHNNAAYHALLAGDLMAARTHSATGLALAETYGVRVVYQWLYSTRGELALAEGQWAEAEAWFTRGMAEAQRHGNRSQLATYQANLGLAARGRGDRDGARLLLEQARQQAAALMEPHLQSQIDLWLAEVYVERGEHAAALEALTRAERRLAGGEHRRLQTWARQVRAAVSQVMSARPPSGVLVQPSGQTGRSAR